MSMMSANAPVQWLVRVICVEQEHGVTSGSYNDIEGGGPWHSTPQNGSNKRNWHR